MSTTDTSSAATTPDTPGTTGTPGTPGTAGAPVAGSEAGPRRGAFHDLSSASQRTLVWRAFRRHKLAVAGAAVTGFILLVSIFVEFLAPYDPNRRMSLEDTGSGEVVYYTYAPPQLPKFIHRADDGSWDLGLYVNGYRDSQDPDSLRITYAEDPTQRIPIQPFAKGDEYLLFGVIPWDRHLIGPSDPSQPMFLLGTDRGGRDLTSQLIYATRISMSVGLVGVLLAFLLGVVLGGISGYFSGPVDTFVQRLIEFVMAVPSIPLWLGLAAALPTEMSVVARYFLITTILAVIAWTGLAREVRGRFLSLRTEDFVTSAWLDGSSRSRVMFRHMLPSFTSHLIAALTLSIPTMIIAETALSWLGLGLTRPATSLGVLLEEASRRDVIENYSWLLLPGGAVVIIVLALNFVGDGLRDAADPYRH